MEFTTRAGARGEPYAVPDGLWRLDLTDAFATVVLPRNLHWPGPSLAYYLADRRDRARVYEIVLREGTADDLRTYIDGALLIDLWGELVLPRDLRTAWEPLISRRGGAGE